MKSQVLLLTTVLTLLLPASLQADILYEVIDLGTLGSNWSETWSVNDASQIVGVCWIYGLRERATLFDPTDAGNNIDLGTLGGGESRAYSINNLGQIVGRAKNSQGRFRATLFDPTGAGNNIDLNTLIDPAGGWMLFETRDINNSGLIVGYGTNAQGEGRAFLLVPFLCKLAGDLNDDCKVDLVDFALMAANWLVDCRLDPTNPACVPK